MLNLKLQSKTQVALKDKSGNTRFLTVVGYDTPLLEITCEEQTYYRSLERDTYGNTIYNENRIDERLKLQQYTSA